MLKKVISVLICAVLVLGTVNTALAARVNLSGLTTGTFRKSLKMDKDGNIVEEKFQGWAEYVNPTASADVSMRTGEHVTVSPLHWLDSNYLSYEILALEVSDPTVVSASTYLPQIPNTNELVLIDLKGGRENLGVQLYAKRPGNATVMMVYRTYRTRDGLNYTDKRGSDTYVQEIYVKVDSPLKMHLNISGGGYWKVNSINIRTADATEDIPEPLRDPVIITMADLAGAVFSSLSSGINMVASWGSAIIEGFEMIPEIGQIIMQEAKLSSTSGYATSSPEYLVGDFLNRKGVGLFKGVNGMKNGISTAVEVAKSGTRRKATVFPVCDPANLKLHVTIRNTSDSPLYIPKLIFQANEYFSFSSSIGPWGNFSNPTAHQSFYLQPGQEKSWEMPIYARPAYGDINASGATANHRFAYTASINVSCYYQHADYANTTLVANESIALNAYSTITQDDLDRYIRGMGFNSIYYKNKFNAENLDQLLYIGCPVDVIILDADGKELAVIHSDDENIYENEGIVAAAQGEDKFIMLSPEAAEQYQVKILAVGDGEMDVLTLGADAAGDTDINLYATTAITAGDTFRMVLSGEAAGKLHRLAADGSSVEMEADYSFSRAALERTLAETDLNEEYKEAVTNAYLKCLVPATYISDSYQAPLTVHELFGAMVSIYEMYHGLPSGHTAYTYLQANPEVEELDYLALAVNLGMISQEQAEQLRENAQAPMTAYDVSTYLFALLKLTKGFDDAVTQLYGYDAKSRALMMPLRAQSEAEEETEELTEEEAEAAAEEEAATKLILMAYMIFYGYLPNASADDQAVTRETGIAGLSKLWDDLEAYIRLNDFVLTEMEAQKEEMEAFNAAIFIQKPELTTDQALNSVRALLENQPLYQLNDLLASSYLGVFASNNDFGNLSPVNSPLPANAQFKFFDHMSGSATLDEGRMILQYALAYIPDVAGNILGNDLYLLVLNTMARNVEDGQAINELGKVNKYDTDFMIISDQEAVKNYVDMLWPQVESMGTDAEEAPAPVYPELAKGSQGDEVKTMQQRLIDLGYLSGKADGDYGNKTATAVSAFQKAKGLEETGVADSQTQALLYARQVLSKGSKGSDVKAIQERLIEMGYLKGSADGDYGNKTVNAVSAFQEAAGLEVNGVADLELQSLLLDGKDSRELLVNWLAEQK